jgi:hypothetical protein
VTDRARELGGFHRILVVFAGALAVACVDTSPNRVKLTTGIDKATLSVTKGPLVTVLAGSFDFELSVGDLASGSEVVSEAPSFQLVGAGEQAGLGIDALPPAGTFPLTLEAGAKQTVVFTLTDQNTLAAADAAAVCAGPVRIVASYRDSLSGNRATSIESGPTTVSGCSP